MNASSLSFSLSDPTDSLLQPPLFDPSPDLPSPPHTCPNVPPQSLRLLRRPCLHPRRRGPTHVGGRRVGGSSRDRRRAVVSGLYALYKREADCENRFMLRRSKKGTFFVQVVWAGTPRTPSPSGDLTQALNALTEAPLYRRRGGARESERDVSLPLYFCHSFYQFSGGAQVSRDLKEDRYGRGTRTCWDDDNRGPKAILTTRVSPLLRRGSSVSCQP